MKRLLLFLLTSPCFAVTLNTPQIAAGDQMSYLGPKYSIFTGTYNPGLQVSFAPGSGNSDTPIDWTNAQGVTICYTFGSSMPAATTPGTCSVGTTATIGQAVSITGTVAINVLATAVGQTNSAINTQTPTIPPFFPVAWTYAYSPVVTLSGILGGNVIYTTDGSTPTASGSCTATNGTAVANGSTITISTTATVKSISCVGGTTASLGSALYTIRSPQTWFVRTDGGTRYSVNVTAGQCDGTTDTAYPGTGTNQHCAFNDFRYMWDDDSGLVGIGAWIIAGGDTVVIRGCTALATQQNPSNPDCRIGWDINSGGGSSNNWCNSIGGFACTFPTLPSGSVSQPTRILGGCAYGTYTCTPIDNSFPYGTTNEAQIFGGFGLDFVFLLNDTQSVVLEGLEITTHNGAPAGSSNQGCSYGTQAYPTRCITNAPFSDFANNGVGFNHNSINVTMQDVYIHRFASAGIEGAFGGTFSMTRVNSSFNWFAGWNMDNGISEPDVSSAQLLASYVTMIGNGCSEQYPDINPSFPALSCSDDANQGFGDAWSGQDTNLAVFTCDHCYQAYNTKDAFIGPHPNITNLTITNSTSLFSMGAQWKFITAKNGTVTMENNWTNGLCTRMAAAVPGAAQNFALSSGLGGSYLSDYCRGGGNTVAANIRPGTTAFLANNTWVGGIQSGMIDVNCGTAYNNNAENCTSIPVASQNNIYLGYFGTSGANPPAQFENDASGSPTVTFTSSHDDTFGMKASTGQTCGTSGVICTDPLLMNEPAQPGGGWTAQNFLDVIEVLPCPNSTSPCSAASPAIGAGLTVSGLTTDYFGVSRPNPPAIGAAEPFVNTAFHMQTYGPSVSYGHSTPY